MNNLKLSTFTITLFISATLMFGLQPMIGKMLLPIVGGSPSGWIVALSFFQTMLLVGYFIAHALSKFSPIKHTVLYLILLSIGAVFLPISVKNIDLSTSLSPAFSVLTLLTIAVAIPFISISATNSTIQRLFTISRHTASEDPYFLYAASNIGSFVGLILYPFVIEPIFTISEQSFNWSIGYVLLIIFTILCLIIVLSQKQHKEKKVIEKKATNNQRMEWVALSFIPSALLSAVTTHITTDIFSAPLIWIIPLSIYLLTFVIAFSRKQIISYNIIKAIHPISISIAFFLVTIADNTISVSIYAMLLHIAVFTVIALMSHMKLAKKRPSAGKLTEFYLAMSIGGALGGAVNAFVVPFIFNGLYEYPIFLIASCLIHDSFKRKVSRKTIYSIVAGLALIFTSVEFHTTLIDHKLILFSILTAGFILIALHPKPAFLATSYCFLVIMISTSFKSNVFSTRNFYGVIKVYNKHIELEDNELVEAKFMRHGTTVHGFQFTDKKRETTPTSYYYKDSPISVALDTIKPKNIAVVGIGAGILNCYIGEDQELTFIEIDQNAIDVAKDQFTYLTKCGQGMPDIILGDGRLKIEEHTGNNFNMIVMDAFSSDTIPTHLLTKEAMEIYFNKLSKNGVLAFHISNRYFDLAPNIVAIANSLGLHNILLDVYEKDVPKSGIGSKWVLLSKDKQPIEALRSKGYKSLTSSKEDKVWTDEYVDILDSLIILKDKVSTPNKGQIM